jgi:hypothetical protein
MNRFYRGFRVDEIVFVYPSDDEKYPTNILFRNGASGRAPVPWTIAVAEIERLLAEAAEEEVQVEARKREASRYEAQVETLKGDVAKLESARQAARSALLDEGHVGKLAGALRPVLGGERTYIIATEKNALRELLQSLGVEI